MAWLAGPAGPTVTWKRDHPGGPEPDDNLESNPAFLVWDALRNLKQVQDETYEPSSWNHLGNHDCRPHSVLLVINKTSAKTSTETLMRILRLSFTGRRQAAVAGDAPTSARTTTHSAEAWAGEG